MNKPNNRPKDVNSVNFQSLHWREELENYDWQSDEIYGNVWGNPEDPNDRWGNHVSIRNRLIGFARPDKVLLEIGSLAGKWTQYLLASKRIICVDLNERR